MKREERKHGHWEAWGQRHLANTWRIDDLILIVDLIFWLGYEVLR